MAVFVVMEQPAGSRAEADADPVFVRDGFHLLAFLIPPFWFGWHGLWIEAIVALAVTMGVSALGAFGPFAEATPALALLASLYFGLEAANLRVAALRRRGWREWGVVEADGVAEAETRQAIDGEARAPASHQVRAPVPNHAGVTSGPALGMLDYPGRR